MKMHRMMKRFLYASDGSVMILVGLSMMLIIAAGGAAIDIGRQQLVRAKLQQATDAGAVACAALPVGATDADCEQAADRYFRLNYPDTYMGIARPGVNVDIAGDTVTVTTPHIDIETYFMWAAEVDTLPIDARTVVGRGNTANVQPYDLVLAIDNSASMAFADVGAGSTAPADNVPSARAAGLAACQADEVNVGFPPGYLDCPSTQDGPWILPTTWGFGLTGDTRLNAARFAADSSIASKLLNPNTSNSRVGVVGWSHFITFEQPLTDVYAPVRNALYGMYGYGSTNSTLGLERARAMLAVVPPDPSRVKAVVLLTDGYNTLSGPPSYNSSVVSTNMSDSNGCTGSTIEPVCAPANVASLGLCTMLKNDGVRVYTIAFGQEVTTGAQAADARAFLQDCASPNPLGGSNEGVTFFPAPDAAALQHVFEAIITNVRTVRITE